MNKNFVKECTLRNVCTYNNIKCKNLIEMNKTNFSKSKNCNEWISPEIFKNKYSVEMILIFSFNFI